MPSTYESLLIEIRKKYPQISETTAKTIMPNVFNQMLLLEFSSNGDDTDFREWFNDVYQKVVAADLENMKRGE